MNTRAALLITLGLTLSTAFAADPTNQTLSEVLSRLVAQNDGHGGGVARIATPRQVIWQDATGLTAGPGSAPMTTDVPFEVASITKAVTAATILRLVEDGKLSLDSTLGQLLPNESRGFNSAITIRQLLSHTSGLPDYWTDGPKNLSGDNAFLRAFNADPNRSWLPNDTLGYAREIPAKKPGSRFHYSDTNYVLLGRIIERTTGQPYHRAIHTYVLDPLGMTSTWLTYHEPRRGAAPSHRYEGTEDMTNVPRQSADWAGGGLVSTTRDLERLLRGLATGRLFHRAGTLATMRSFVPAGQQDISYGLGLYRVDLGKLGELWGHDGHANSFAYYWPQRDITFTGTLNQTENDWWPLVEAFVEDESADVALESAENDQAFNAFLSTGYDSLYMYRGVNSLRNPGSGYGTGLYWTELNFTWNITDSDFLTFDAWNALGLDNTGYREFDTVIAYTRMIEDFALTFEYDFFYGYGDAFFYSHELALTLSRDFDIHGITLTPSLTYNYNLGPDSSTGLGTAKVNSSFLLFRLDGNIPIYHDIIALAPWTSFGLNFNYNTREIGDGETTPFTGANNFELGVALPIKVSKVISLSGYIAYSHAFTDLPATEPNTFWAGASVTFSY